MIEFLKWLPSLLETPANRIRERAEVGVGGSSVDCGYACASAIFAVFGRPMSVPQIKVAAGNASRGLTLRQLRDLLVALGATAHAVRFDRKRAECYPVPGIILLRASHFVAIERRRGNWFEIFDPQLGWTRVRSTKLARQANGLGVHVTAVSRAELLERPAAPRDRRHPLLEIFLRHAMSSLGVRILGLSLAAQIVVLTIPLLSMRSVDVFHIGTGSRMAGTLAFAFILISATNIVMDLTRGLLSQQLSRRMSVGAAGAVFDRLASRPASWFEERSPSDIRNLEGSVEQQIVQLSSLLRSIGGWVVTFCVGICALIVISPWLAAPGLLSLGLSVSVGIAYGRPESEATITGFEARRRRQAFVIETMSQIPLFARFGTLWQGRVRYKRVVRRAADAEAHRNYVQNRKSTITTAIKGLETIFFVSLTAFFVGRDHLTLGAFVAVGSYKDLLAQSLTAMYQAWRQFRLSRPLRMLTHELLDSEPVRYGPGRALENGRVSLADVSFSYGELDDPILSAVCFKAEPGEFVAIVGPSGAGKSTIAKLICGLVEPQAGEILLDGQPPLLPMGGFGAVFQSDRLLSGTIRENIGLFRKNISDDEIYAALEMATLKEFVTALPLRLNTMVGEGKAGLSGGQRQRLLLARALIGKPKLLLLDEATSNIDVAGEAKIFENLLATGATLIVIAHRPEVWRFADRIYQVSGGRVELAPNAKAAEPLELLS